MAIPTAKKKRRRPRRRVVLPRKSSSNANYTRAGQKALRQYYQALGEFVDQFAHVETSLHFALRWHSTLREPLPRVFLSGVRAEQAISFLKRMAEIGEIDSREWVQLRPVLDQISHINKARNLILHYGVSDVVGGAGFASDDLVALTQDRTRKHPISVAILDSMTADLLRISVLLVCDHSGLHPVGETLTLVETRRDAWLYTPPQPPPRNPGQSKGRVHRRQPKSSRA